jgi:hypothetical protein
MAPIANPEDMSPEQRQAVYGHRYDADGRAFAGEPRRLGARTRVHQRLHASRPAPAQPAEASASSAAAPAPSSKQADRLLQLQSDLSGPFGQAAVWIVPEDVAAGKPGAVTLSLPASALDQIRVEAGKEQLSDSAAKIQIRATLGGDGYLITPTVEQTAAVASGRSLTFTWQVAPQAGATPTALKVQASAELLGAGGDNIVPLLSQEKPVKAGSADAEATPAKADDGPLAWLNQQLGGAQKPGAAPGAANVAVALLIAIAVLILIGLALVAAARQSQAREQERRRRARAAAAARFDEQTGPARTTTTATTTRVEVHPPENV